MTTIKKCLDDAVAAGRLTRKQGKEFLDKINKAERYTTLRGPAGDADAVRDAIQWAKERAIQRKLEISLNAAKTENNMKAVEINPSGAYEGVASIAARGIKKGQGANVESRAQALYSTAQGMFKTAMEAWRSKNAGLSRDLAGPLAMIRATYPGSNTGDPVAAEGAKRYQDVMRWFADMWRAEGGRIDPRAFYLPQRFERDRLMKDGADVALVDYMKSAWRSGKLKMIDWETGDPLSEQGVDAILKELPETIRTDGMNKITAGEIKKSAFRERYNMQRVFEWTDADAWIDFNRQWGVGDSGIYGLLDSHMRDLARDVALIQVLGTNPDQMMRTLIDQAGVLMTRQKVDPGTIKRNQQALQSIYAHVNGDASKPADERLARIGQGVRSGLSAAQLTGAILSAPTDFAFTMITARLNGMPMMGWFGDYLKRWAGDPMAREASYRGAAEIEVGISSLNRSAREGIEGAMGGFMQRASDTLMRMGGLPKHTEDLRHSFINSLQNSFVEDRGKSFDQLSPLRRQAFERYGIDAKMWQLAQTAQSTEVRSGIPVWDVVKGMNTGVKEQREAVLRLHQYTLREADFAVPTPGARERSLLGWHSGAQPGTPSGELFRTLGQYKSFPAFMVMGHAYRAFYGLEGAQRGAYIAATMAATMPLAAFSIQLKELAKGRDAKDMSDPKFWGEAFMQAGGAGIYGDFFRAATNRDGREMISTLAGPGFGAVQDVAKATFGNILPGFDPEREANIGRDFVNLGRRYTPGAALPYARLALDRLIWDRVQTMVDPNYRDAFQRTEQRIKKDTGQMPYWSQGESMPSRMPGMATAPGALF